MPLESMDLHPGQQLGPYVVQREVGRGAFGVVYEASHRARPRERVALKVLEARGGTDRHLLEAQILSRLVHPHIVRLYDSFFEGGRVVMAMEYIDGPSLDVYLRDRGPLPPAVVAELLCQIAEALRVAHALNVVHRDIKPGNILVEQRAGGLRFVLADFGVSRIMKGIQMTPRRGGTYRYMAPEQLRGRPVPQSDLWALGTVAYQMRTGRLPFDGKSLEELTGQVLFQPPQAPGHLAREPAPDLDALILHLLEKELPDRLPSAHALTQHLASSKLAEAPALAPPSLETGGLPTAEAKARRKLLLQGAFLGISLVILILPQFFLPGLTLLGALLVFDSSRARRPWRSLFGGLLLVLGVALTFLAGQIVGEELFGRANGASKWGFVVQFWSAVFGSLAVYFYLKVRQQRRDIFIMRAVREAAEDSTKVLAVMHDFVRSHQTDVAVAHRYIELLLAAGQSSHAIAEATVALEIDPYNATTSLLLAHGYFESGLLPECEQVCSNYLSISGHLFEFADLRQRCQAAR